MLIPQLCQTDLDLSIKPVAAIFMKDYPYKDLSMISDDILYLNDFEDDEKNKKFEAIMSSLRPKYQKPKGISFRDLIKDVEGVTVLNLKRGVKTFN